MPLASGARRAPEPDGIDFTVSSSLPPMVAGSVAGEMELSVPYLYPKPGVLCSTRYLGDGQSEPMFVVRMQWWGDSGPGTVFKPGLLRGRDEDGERARRVQLSKATCALFPVRCALDGLLTYLTDMGSIVLDVLVHEGDPSGGARHAGRCVVPVGGSSWGGHGQRESRVVAEGYFPVLSLRDGSSKVRTVLAVAKMATTTADESSPAGEGGRRIADGGTPFADRSGSTAAGHEEVDAGRRSGLGFRRSGEAYVGLPERASFDSADLTNGWSEAPPPGDAATTERLARDSAPLSSFQLNEALAKFDASDTLPIWPTPRGSLYRPPEALGQALSAPAIGQHQANRGRPAGAGANNAGPRRKASPTSKTVGGRLTRSPPARVGVALTGTTRVASVVGGAPPERKTGDLRPSVSPERQAPEPATGTDLDRASVSLGDGRGGRRDETPAPPSQGPPPPSAAAAPAGSAAREDGAGGLSELLNRGKELRDKMALAAAGSNDRAPPASPSSSGLATLTAQPGLVSGAPLDSSLRDDIEGIFDTLSDVGQGVDVSVRDPETRGGESRVVDLLLSAAGPPPASLAFPALAAMERRRADSLARVRFLRIRLSRLVMFGSMTSAGEGHGWQLRFRLPAFAAPPGRGSTAAAGRRASVAQASKGGSARNARVVSVPVPPRVSPSTLGKGKAAAAVRRGRSTATGTTTKTTTTTSRSAASVLRVRRGFGACDLVVGETSLLEELVCAVDVDDTCVAQWMDTAVEFLLVDGRTDGAPRPRQPGKNHNHPHLRKKQRSSTVGPGDRVAAVATFPLRDLVLSADLGVAATLDLIEVSDFWAAEDARAAAAGRTGRGGRPLRNPYRSDEGGGGARPLVLGDRAVGALAIALELVPGEPDVSPEHSRPEVERWTKGSRQQGAAAAATAAAEAEGLEESAEEEHHGVIRTEASSPPPLPAGGVRILREPSADGRDGTFEAGGEACSAAVEPGGWAEGSPGGEKHEPSGSLTASMPPDLDGDGDWKEASGVVAVGPLDTSLAVVLRIGDLTLAPPLGPGAEQVRVAYSFTQVEGLTPTVTHRSVRGLPSGDGGAQQHFQRFAFNHQEVFPAPTESSAWRLGGAGANRVFEVWGCSATGPESGSSGGRPGQAEALLGLAKVYLRPFAAFEGRTGESGLAVGADGPVSVVDPFSGKAVGDLHLLLALGASPTIAALAGKGGDAEAGNGAMGDPPTLGGGSNAEGGRETGEEKGDHELEDEGGAGSRGGAAGGAEGEGGGGVAHAAEPPALDDSVAELSMLLNPGRVEGPKASPARSSGGFTGLVRHVVELSAVGELPVVVGDGIAVGGEGAQEPVGCAIEYVLPSSQTCLDLDIDGTDTPPTTADQTHELWWDADSGILNSRARHTVKVPGGILDKPAAPGSAGSTGGGAGQSSGDAGTAAVATTTEGGPLNNLLDCMFGHEDVVLSLFAGVAAAGTGGARPEAPWGDGGRGRVGESVATSKRQGGRSLIGKAVLRRADLLPLVRRTSARAVLRLPIEPADDTGEGVLLAAPEALPLSVSYRREPSAVARRKSRGRCGRREAPSEESHQGLDVSCDAEVAGLPSIADLGKEEAEGRGECEASGVRGHDASPGAVSSSSPPHGAASSPEEGFGGSGDGGGYPDSCESATGPLARRTSRTEHLLPARTKLCVHVDSVRLTSGVGDVGGEEQVLLWVSFDFPGPESGGRPERKRGGVYVWKPGDEKEERRREVQWSPAVVAARQEERDLVALLQWRLELPVTIDAAFVEFVNTQSLELRVWSGNREDWPAGGSPCGVAKVALRSLLTTLGGVGGDAAVITPGEGVVGGNVAARLFFKHRGLGSGDDGTKRTVELPGAGTHRADEEEARGGIGARRRLPVSFREGVEVLGEERGARTGAGSPAQGPAAGAAVAAATTTATTTPRQASPDKSLRTPPPRGAPEERRAAASDSPSVVVKESNVLRVCVERAMRLEAIPAAAAAKTLSGDPETVGCAALPPDAVLPPPPPSPPSTYVTLRWEEEGKPPLRSPLLSGPAAASGEAGAAEGEEESALTADGEVITPIVETSSNPVFNHVARLRLVDRDAWDRVCGPSAALVFRVWRRARCEWWEAAPRAPSNGGGSGGYAEHQPSFAPDDKGSVVAAGSRFGDKLIGSAVVGLEVLRGKVHAPDGLGLREIDGWYHVLDDMQRPRGQIKVRVCPQPPSSSAAHLAPEPPPAFPEVPPGVGTGHETLGLPATFGPSPAAESSGTGNDGGVEDADGDVEDAPPSPPLHDTQAHLRSVHALLDSLPDEFRSSSRPRQPLPTSSAGRAGVGLGLPSLSEEPPPPPPPSVNASPPVPPQSSGRAASGAARQHGGCEPTGGIPELRRMLSSLDKVDRRLFALGDDDDDPQSSGGSADVEFGSEGRGRAGGGGPAVGGAPDMKGSTSEAKAGAPPADTVVSTGRRHGTDHHLAISRLQEAWRARSRRRREAAEAEARRRAYALRRKRRESAAVAIQRAHRRAQARHRARAAAEERRRWEDRRRRRSAACAVLERAWRAFDSRRRAAREVAEARARAAAAVAAAEATARKSEQTARGAVLIQAVWRGVSARAATARRIDASRERLRAAAAASRVPPAEREASSPHRRVAGGIAVEPRPAPPSTFYNQLSQDPRRGHRLQLPEAHLAALPLSRGLPPPFARSRAASSSSAARDDGSRAEEEARADTRPPERLEPRRLARSAGAGRPPRFADQETARIARIMKGNLQHWASARSSSSSDELNL
ncbi:conserved unknown protein [Ectocarpus siliculosus]|uniref:C2CD3 N-terminal C2 domain-containing protein n=1 Tax=Ectocarpus siliculosus TaxID=2880 RepID=D7G7R4_ECTSI|nr:conserved unknown protein [Ectocarpus siliculosus]|eukprot:CBJ27795.1 conserved unknown protein [Ectocarpus siliculosus]